MKRSLRIFEKAYCNLFISEFTLDKMITLGFKPSVERDLVLHNNIDVSKAKFIKKNLSGELHFVCVARDVPHKNLEGVYQYAKTISEAYDISIKLYLTSNRFESHHKVEVIPIVDLSDEEIGETYKKCHLNFLLSLDESHRGFYEGFGLTVLEAAQYGTPSVVLNTGGLRESVHDNSTGWVLDSFVKSTILKQFEKIQKNYEEVARQSFEHTLGCHGLDIYKEQFKRILNL